MAAHTFNPGTQEAEAGKKKSSLKPNWATQQDVGGEKGEGRGEKEREGEGKGEKGRKGEGKRERERGLTSAQLLRIAGSINRQQDLAEQRPDAHPDPVHRLPAPVLPLISVPVLLICLKPAGSGRVIHDQNTSSHKAINPQVHGPHASCCKAGLNPNCRRGIVQSPLLGPAEPRAEVRSQQYHYSASIEED